MIGHELAQCRVIHDQGHVPGPQHIAVPKQHKEYWKKDSQPKLVEGPIGNLTTDAPGGTNAWPLLVHLAYDKTDGERMIFHICLLSRMPWIMIGPHPGKSCSVPLLIHLGFQNRGW